MNGLFNRTDPYSGNLNDPQSLHKYLYCHNNPVNSIDPSGKFGDFSLTGMMQNMMIQLAVSSIINNVVVPLVETFPTFFIPKSLRNILENGLNFDAISYGLNITLGPSKLPIGFQASPELLVGRNSGKWAFYLAAGLTTNRSVSVTADVGFVFNSPTANDYRRDFFNLTIPYRSLPRKWQIAIRRNALKSLAATLDPVSAALQLSDFGLTSDAIRRAAQPIASKVLDHSVITFFWSHSGTACGLSIGYSHQFRPHISADRISFGIQEYFLMKTQTGEGRNMKF